MLAMEPVKVAISITLLTVLMFIEFSRRIGHPDIVVMCCSKNSLKSELYRRQFLHIPPLRCGVIGKVSGTERSHLTISYISCSLPS